MTRTLHHQSASDAPAGDVSRATPSLGGPDPGRERSDAPESGLRCPVRHATAVAEANPVAVGWAPRDLHRWTLAGVGVLATALAIIGAIVPGMPTTIFVIVAAWCFTRSCPVLEERLLRNRLLRPSMEIVDGTRSFTRRARATVMATMAIFASGSVALLAWSDRLAPATFWTIVGLVAVGAVAIACYRPAPRRID